MSDRPHRMFRRRPWEWAAISLICAGVVMLMQPFALLLYTWSFVVTLAGIVLYTVASKFPD